MADIFVSYKKENRAHAERYAALFARQGFSVWWDDNITPHQDWDKTIEREIAAATSVVVLWSTLSVMSDWVRREAHYGYGRGRLVPVMVERCELPLAFQMTQTIDLSAWGGDMDDRHWRKLVAWISDNRAAPIGDAPGARAAAQARAIVGTMPSGEPIVEGALVDTATPAGTLFQDHAGAPVMRLLPPGEFLIGGAPGDPDRLHVETPQKSVRLAQPFAMSVYPVTRAQYELFGPPPAGAPAPAPQGWFGRRAAPAAPPVAPGAPDDPVSHVSFDEAGAFAKSLSTACAALYRLPSEAEWEYACRAGSQSRYHWGDAIDPSHALYRSEGAGHTGPCAPGRFAPNGFGLYDMHGNIREWIEDLWHETYDLIPPDGRPAVDGHGALRVTRGGGWSDPPSVLRSSARGRATQTIRSDVVGFRVVRVL